MKKIVVTLLLAAILLTMTPMSATLAEASYATVQSGNQYGVRLRLGPGTNYASQTTLPSGTVVTVLEPREPSGPAFRRARSAAT